MKDQIADLAARTLDLDRETKRLIRAIRNSRMERVGIAMILVVVAGLGVLTWQQAKTNNRQTKINHATAVASQELVRQIESCTVPTGACYQRGAKTTGQAVARINTFTLVAAEVAVECARTGGTDNQIESCVKKKIAAALPR